MYKHAAGTGALNAKQVKDIYNGGITLNYKGSHRGNDIVGWYKLDGNPNDSSGNGRNGTNDTSTSYAAPDSTLQVESSISHKRPIQEVVYGQKEQTLPFIFGVKGFPSLRRAPQV